MKLIRICLILKSYLCFIFSFEISCFNISKGKKLSICGFFGLFALLDNELHNTVYALILNYSECTLWACLVTSGETR